MKCIEEHKKRARVLIIKRCFESNIGVDNLEGERNKSILFGLDEIKKVESIKKTFDEKRL